MRRALRLSLVWLVMGFAINAFAQPRIDLSKGTLFLSGGLSFDYGLVVKDKLSHKLSLVSDLSGGYFIIDKLAVGAGVPIEWNFAAGLGRIAFTKEGRLGLKVFSTYYFDLGGVVFPYVGASLTPAYNLGEKAFKLSAGVDGGVLVSLSESIALDFGLKPELFFKLNQNQDWELRLPAGFLGIKAVF